MKKLLCILIPGLTALTLSAQSPIVKAYKPVADSLKTLLEERTSVKTSLRLDKVMHRGDLLDIYFTQELSDYPWRKEDVQWFQKELKKQTPAAYRSYPLGEIFAGGTPLKDLVMPALGNDGKPVANAMRVADPKGKPVIENIDVQAFRKGLYGRHIALWQSHGRYFEAKTDRWEWQRATLHRTVEDMYTQSYVLPFLIPMLENAGAYVMTPRERDTSSEEVVCDNDTAFSGPRDGLRQSGRYVEKGSWTDAGTGFADAKAVYTGYDNPFTMGSARQAEMTAGKEATATIRWYPDFDAPRRLAVYISYKTVSGSTDAASYTVHHLGGESRFRVNQKAGGGIWMYLGTFDMGPGSYVSLDNRPAPGQKYVKGSVVTADAVRFGGGVGKIARGLETTDPSEWTVSGLPSFAEGAMYSMQWSGMDMHLLDEWENDYQKDYAGRGKWVSYLSGGSRANPNAQGKGIPFDLSLAFHTDAGLTPDDRIVGTLSIYTLLCEGSDKLPNGESRYNGRELADLVQTQIVEDVRKDFEPDWTRRQLWNRSYSESRTPSVPAMLLELLSHQNFADMKYGLDPTFRFTVSRAIYKGMLKYLSNRYGCNYAVQPLPVGSFAAELADGKARLSWKATPDPQEPTADPTGYILYTRIDDGSFDNGVILKDVRKADGIESVTVPIAKGHLYSFKIVAFNEGGKSFPSEVLAVGTPVGEARKVLIVNNFNRLSPPAWFDTPTYAGFSDATDSGVSYGDEINFIGEVYQFRRSDPWTDDDNPGFGGSFTDKAGKLIPGNTFDYPAFHGRALLKAGFAVASMSADAFTRLVPQGYLAADIICGKQVTTLVGRGAAENRYPVFPEAFRKAVTAFTASGSSVLISGAYIGTDATDRVYDIAPDSTYRAEATAFINNVLGYKWLTNFGSHSGKLVPYTNPYVRLGGDFHFVRDCLAGNENRVYQVENPDGILPAGDKSFAIMKYDDTKVTAGTAYDAGNYRCVAFGFPIETLVSPKEADRLLASVMNWFNEK
jgi:hypothetical protein